MSENQTALAKIEPEPGSLLQVSQVKARLDAVVELMRSVMKEGIQGDYGSIPGTGDKKCLLKPGAEKLGTLFRLSPTYQTIVTNLDRGHREYTITCTLTHIPTQCVWGQAMGSCSTMESKYRWRGGGRKCPRCGSTAIKKSKFPPRGAPAGTAPGWYCHDKAGGCGENFAAGDPDIENQQAGRTENPDLADTYNTVLKIATKRAFVAAVLIATGASALFTQDQEEGVDGVDAGHDARPAANPANKNEAARPAAVPDPAKGVERGRITEVKLHGQSDAGAAKPWRRWAISVGDRVLYTFSQSIKDAAEAMLAEDSLAVVKWTNKGRGALIDDFQPADVGAGDVASDVEGELVG